jgi:hypothetical protein
MTEGALQWNEYANVRDVLLGVEKKREICGLYISRCRPVSASAVEAL